MKEQNFIFTIGILAVTVLNGVAFGNTGLVEHVFDGDTILVKIRGVKEKVRLLGIDAPETKGPYTKQEPFGNEAKEFVRQTVKGKTVKLIYGKRIRDKYKRLLAYVILPDGTSLNELILKKGLARAYRKFRYDKKKFFIRLEHSARKNRAGMWGGGR